MPLESADPAHDDATLRFYADEAPVYVASGEGFVNSRLHGFLALLPPGARILELGCGGGRDAEAMIAAGFNVDPTDGTAAIALEAEQRLGRHVKVMRFDELEAENIYDGVWANASLLHVPRAALPAILGRIHKALKPGGVHFASYKGGGTEGRDGFGRYYNYFSREHLEEAYLASANWDVVSAEDYTGGGYDGRQCPWVAVTAYRPQ